MRHRIIGQLVTGLGNSEPEILNNKGRISQEFASDAISTYFADIGGLDFALSKDAILVGVEPAYQYEKLLLIKIARKKGESSIVDGKAWGPYGSRIAKKERKYNSYKLNSKFVRFVDKWHPILFPKS